MKTMNSKHDLYEKINDGRCKECDYSRIHSGGGWSFLGCSHEPYTGKWVSEIKYCPKRSVKVIHNPYGEIVKGD